MCKQLAENKQVSVYIKDLTSKFWEGYWGQQFVIFNDYSGEFPVADLKRWTDAIGRVDVKGSSQELHRDLVIIITANKDMHEVYRKHFNQYPIDKTALCHRVISLNSRGLYTLLHQEYRLIPEYIPAIVRVDTPQSEGPTDSHSNYSNRHGIIRRRSTQYSQT